MKHEPQVGSTRWLSRYDRPSRRENSFPRVDGEFQPRREGNWFGDGDWPPRRREFYREARATLRADSKRDLWLEGFIFGLVSVVCVWPLATVIHQAYLLWR